MTHCRCHHCWNTAVITSWCSHSMFGLQKHSVSFDECQCVQFFSQGGIQFHAFASDGLLFQISVCQTAPPLPSVTQQQNVMDYWWECLSCTAMQSTSISNAVGQHNIIESVTFRAVLILWFSMILHQNSAYCCFIQRQLTKFIQSSLFVCLFVCLFCFVLF